jgi:GDPmannose 4,6-dehydratase
LKRALITGITGQDGSFLAELLLAKGYEVHGMIRRCSTFNTDRIDHIYQDPHTDNAKLFLHFGDMTENGSIRSIIEKSKPDEVYNLAAQSHVRVSFDQSEYTMDVVGLGTLRLLEALKDVNGSVGKVRFYQAGSSEMFGSSPPPHTESTPFHPRSPYAVAKAMAHMAVVNYRESYGMFACNGILFNHESERRGETFVTRKITRAMTRIKCGLQKELFLGNLDAKRDWGYAKDYVEAMWLMLQDDSPDDYIVATGESRSVREFLEIASAELSIDYLQYIKIDPRYIRPAEVDHLCGDASKIRNKLGWKPRTSFEEMIKIMLLHDIGLASAEKSGKKVFRE